MPLLIPKMDLLYGYSVGGYRYCVGNLFWVWVCLLLETAGVEECFDPRRARLGQGANHDVHGPAARRSKVLFR